MSINAAMLLAGVLLLLGIASSKFTARLGVPVLALILFDGDLGTPLQALDHHRPPRFALPGVREPGASPAPGAGTAGTPCAAH